MLLIFLKQISRLKDEQLHIPVQFAALTFALILCSRAAPEPFTFSLNFLNTQLPSFSFFNLFLFHHHSNGAAPAADQKFICKLKPRLKSPPSKQAACTNKLFKIETFKSFSRFSDLLMTQLSRKFSWKHLGFHQNTLRLHLLR